MDNASSEVILLKEELNNKNKRISELEAKITEQDEVIRNLKTQLDLVADVPDFLKDDANSPLLGGVSDNQGEEAKAL